MKSARPGVSPPWGEVLGPAASSSDPEILREHVEPGDVDVVGPDTEAEAQVMSLVEEAFVEEHEAGALPLREEVFREECDVVRL